MNYDDLWREKEDLTLAIFNLSKSKHESLERAGMEIQELEMQLRGYVDLEVRFESNVVEQEQKLEESWAAIEERDLIIQDLRGSQQGHEREVEVLDEQSREMLQRLRDKSSEYNILAEELSDLRHKYAQEKEWNNMKVDKSSQSFPHSLKTYMIICKTMNS